MRNVLDRLPYVGRLRSQVRDQGLFPAGHYYSPIPSRDEVDAYLAAAKNHQPQVPEVDLNTENQFRALESYERFYSSLPFPENAEPAHRYYYAQNFFCYSDAIFLYSFLRQNNPRRIVEVGSGFSSAVILDTVDGFFQTRPEVTFIEPYPERLLRLLRASDQARLRVLEEKVQDIPLETFTSLRSGDLLFIDSSHVVKCGSDVHFLMFKVLPHLAPGVFVHFHDIFFPFEYPAGWLRDGRYWNEAYLVRAFLAHNNDWEIHFFNDYVGSVFKEFLAKRMPLCLKNTGASLYLRHKGPTA